MFKDQYDLFYETDQYLIRPKFEDQYSDHFYPSEASVITHDSYGDKITHGGCLRASYYRISKKFKKPPHDIRSEYIFMQGKAIEVFLIDLWKKMGIWVDNNVKFFDEKNNISGELDAILLEPPHGQLYGLECKSFYGYNAEKEILGNKWQKGYPKMSHLIQTLVYLNHFQDRLPYFRIAYFARDSVKRRTFKVNLFNENGLLYPQVEGSIRKDFSIQDILTRFKELSQYIQQDVLPPRDFELQYSDEKIKDFYKKGKIAKTKYEKWEKSKSNKEIIGDWQCSYCNYCKICNQ